MTRRKADKHVHAYISNYISFGTSRLVGRPPLQQGGQHQPAMAEETTLLIAGASQARAKEAEIACRRDNDEFPRLHDAG